MPAPATPAPPPYAQVLRRLHEARPRDEQQDPAWEQRYRQLLRMAVDLDLEEARCAARPQPAAGGPAVAPRAWQRRAALAPGGRAATALLPCGVANILAGQADWEDGQLPQGITVNVADSGTGAGTNFLLTIPQGRGNKMAFTLFWTGIPVLPETEQGDQ